MQKKEYSIEVGGKTLTAQFTDLSDQASGSVILRYGNTAVLATAVMGGEREGLDYFPLSVEFEEKFYAAGAILGSRFQRREGRPSEEAVLSARVVDRTIRPLFDHSLRRDVQVIITVLAIEDEDPDVLGVIGASLALGTSDIPWGGPVSAVRIGQINGEDEFIINPTYTQRTEEVETLDLLACGKDGNINMIEVGAKEVPEERLGEGMERAVGVHNELQAWQQSIINEIGKEKQDIPSRETSDAVKKLFEEHIAPKMSEYVFGKAGAYALKTVWMALAKEQLPEEVSDAGDYFEEKVDELVHVEALENNRRQDGRAMDEIRPLYAQAGGVSDLIHGTGIFYRGGTHVLSALTLGGPEDAQLIDTIESQDSRKRYMHHYNFPPFSVGETGRVGGFNRRMIGHGALAEKALEPVLPGKEEFPYTIRIVSETMASNGSSSQASVCGSTLALMDAGVPITRPVAGIAMGMMSDDSGNYKILTDIQGPEDHFGDMDFKVAGTSEGVTAVQMDVKVSGVPVPVLMEAFTQAKKARAEIMDVMLKAIPEPRADINPRAPKIISLTIKEDQIGLVIGPGGKTINGIKEATGCTEINIEDDGTVYVTGQNGTAEAAAKMIKDLTHEYEAGERFEGEVTRIMDFGAFVKIGPNAEGLVHISELAPFRINKVTDVVSEGERVPVIIKEIDEKERINLSIKDVDPNFATNKGAAPAKPNDNHAKGPKPERNSTRREH
ncbi:polyribonucleotide nucleotidyltransferase [bacterium]|nr:polyribonucleotide nucleotidyltransferase [bacterium]|tara:strand:+ start:5650 stop:7824 length:2175 start_codon:yes stop_codon:yes gene_type:complete